MLEFIDKTTTKNGTPINRANMMAIQGFVAKTTVFNNDGSITETFVGEKTLVKTTRFESNGTISETIS